MTAGVILEKDVKCRKSHRCVWCGETIEAGETVPFYKSIFDGALQNDYYHPECQEAMLECDLDDDGYTAYMFKRGTGEPA